MEALELEVRCKECEGTGGLADSIDRSWSNCAGCKGAGWIPTDLGKRILDLMKHNAVTIGRHQREEIRYRNDPFGCL
jgi:hypothetical protein